MKNSITGVWHRTLAIKIRQSCTKPLVWCLGQQMKQIGVNDTKRQDEMTVHQHLKSDHQLLFISGFCSIHEFFCCHFMAISPSILDIWPDKDMTKKKSRLCMAKVKTNDHMWDPVLSQYVPFSFCGNWILSSRNSKLNVMVKVKIYGYIWCPAFNQCLFFFSWQSLQKHKFSSLSCLTLLLKISSIQCKVSYPGLKMETKG